MIYLSASLQKSGSTLTYHLIRYILEAAGVPDVQMPGETEHDLHPARIRHIVHRFSAEVVAEAEAFAAAQVDRVVTLRTHVGPSTQIEETIRGGRALHNVCIRDPRDVVISKMDALARRDALRDPDLPQPSGDLRTTLRNVQKNIEHVLKWADIPGALILRYEETAFSPHVTIGAICNQLKLDLPASEFDGVFDKAVQMKGQFNVAESNRHRREMSEDDQALVMKTFSSFYERFFPGATIGVENPLSASEIAARRRAQADRFARERRKRLEHAGFVT
jgi:hypothetical protein